VLLAVCTKCGYTADVVYTFQPEVVGISPDGAPAISSLTRKVSAFHTDHQLLTKASTRRNKAKILPCFVPCKRDCTWLYFRLAGLSSVSLRKSIGLHLPGYLGAGVIANAESAQCDVTLFACRERATQWTRDVGSCLPPLQASCLEHLAADVLCIKGSPLFFSTGHQPNRSLPDELVGTY
jgi:hypothetical protein